MICNCQTDMQEANGKDAAIPLHLTRDFECPKTMIKHDKELRISTNTSHIDRWLIVSFRYTLYRLEKS